METVLLVLKVIAGIGTILTGLYALVAPRKVFGFTGLTAEGGRGITEIRAVLGAFFIALGAAALLFMDAKTWTMLGFAYLGVALVRFIFMFIDKSVIKSNIISLIVEIIFGIILVI